MKISVEIYITIGLFYRRLYQYVGTVPASADGPIFQQIFAKYEEMPGIRLVESRLMFLNF